MRIIDCTSRKAAAWAFGVTEGGRCAVRGHASAPEYAEADARTLAAGGEVGAWWEAPDGPHTVATLRVVVDEENHAQAWWDAARATETPAEIAPIIHAGASEAEIPAEAYDRVISWCATLPGWSEGPEYARTPLRFV